MRREGDPASPVYGAAIDSAATDRLRLSVVMSGERGHAPGQGLRRSRFVSRKRGHAVGLGLDFATGTAVMGEVEACAGTPS